MSQPGLPLEERLGGVLLASADAAGPACPADARLWDALEGLLPPEESQRLVLHAGTCAACGLALRLGRELLRERAADGVASLPPAPRPRARGWLAAGLGAALAAAAAVLLWPQPPPSLRGAAPANPLQALTAEGRTGRAGLVLRWTPLPGARYSVRLFTPDLAVLHQQSGLARAEAEIPPAALQALPPGARVAWIVSARLPDGTSTTSPAFFLELE